MIFHMFVRVSRRFSLALLAYSALAGTAHAEWHRAETDHFIVYSEDKLEPTEAFTRDLERFDNALRTLQRLPIKPEKPLSDANKLTIFRTGDIRRIGQLAGSPGVAGFYIARAGRSVAFTPATEKRRDVTIVKGTRTDLDPRSILQHEYTHHFMLHNFPTTYPDWYVEAFAELYATIVLNDDGSFHVGNPPQYRADQIFEMLDVPLSELFNQKHRRDGSDYMQFYGFGWLVAHYLNFAPDRQGQLAAYLKALDRGEDGLTAARTVFGDLGKLSREISRYKYQGRDGKLPGISVKPANYAPPAVEVRPLDAAESAVIGAWLQSRRGVDKGQARGIANAVAEQAQRHANSLFVQLAVAEALLDAKRFPEADAAADRALAIDPNSTEALILKGSIAVEQGKKGTKSRFAEARPFLAKAARIDPQDPRPLILYYLSFQRSGDPIPEDALIGLEQAFDFAASDPEYRIVLARQLLWEGKGPLAKSVVGPLAFSFHGDQKKNKIRPIVDLIEEGKTAEAAAKANALLKEWEEKAEEG